MELNKLETVSYTHLDVYKRQAQEYVEQSVEGPLARKYLLLALSDDREKKMDHTYGVRNVADKWMVGNSVLEINQDDSFYICLLYTSRCV